MRSTYFFDCQKHENQISNPQPSLQGRVVPTVAAIDRPFGVVFSLPSADLQQKPETFNLDSGVLLFGGFLRRRPTKRRSVVAVSSKADCVSRLSRAPSSASVYFGQNWNCHRSEGRPRSRTRSVQTQGRGACGGLHHLVQTRDATSDERQQTRDRKQKGTEATNFQISSHPSNPSIIYSSNAPTLPGPPLSTETADIIHIVSMIQPFPHLTASRLAQPHFDPPTSFFDVKRLYPLPLKKPV